MKTRIIFLLMFFSISYIAAQQEEKPKFPGEDEEISVDSYPELINSAQPVYPEDARKNLVEGKVYLKLLIGSDGKPVEAKVLKSTNNVFDEPAKTAAMKSTFKPALKDGKKIACWVVLPYRFALSPSAEAKQKEQK